MSDISSLTQQIDALGSSSDWWITAGLYLTGLVAFLGLLLFISQWRAIIVGNSRDSAREALGNAKEKAFKLDIEDRKKENLQLQLRIEEEQLKRAELTESVHWRKALINLSGWPNALDEKYREIDRQMNAEPVPPFEPTIFIQIRCEKQREPMWVAHDLAYSIRHAPRMKISKIEVVDGPLREGIVITAGAGSDMRRFRGAAIAAIIDGLRKNFVTAWQLFVKRKDIPPSGFEISIGQSDRIAGPLDFRSEENIKAGVPLTDLPPPLKFTDGAGKDVEFHFDPANDSELKDPTENNRTIEIP